MMNLAWLIPLFPLIGFLISGVGRNMLGKATGWIASLAVLSSFLVSVFVFFQIKNVGVIEASTGFTFIETAQYHIQFNLQVDALTSVFLMVITGIGFLIHLYSISYMSHDKGFGKFFAYLNLFVFSMLILVMGSNFLMMFIGWEGVGLCSYLLIGFWFQNKEYNKAAQKAFVMNRIGDLGFLFGMFLMFAHFGTLEFNELIPKIISEQNNTYLITSIALCLFVGATGKSAQIPLFTWLPDAMAGPTPVSALIHAATMVTAGIYMIARSNFIYSLSASAQNVILIIGLATAFIAATIATRQNDIKKVLAYSTVSQLGFMFIALGVGAYTAAVFHVITHAFFKALLFLGSGSVIHGMSGEQDIRYMGGLKSKMKITYITFFIGCIAIAGIPPLSGFFSKDEIMLHLFSHGGMSVIYWVIAMFAALLTAYYMFRLLFVVFYGKFRGTEEQKQHLHESPSLMTFPLIVLATLSIIGGFIGIPEIMGGSHALSQFLSPTWQFQAAEHSIAHSTEWMLMGIAVFIALIGIILAYLEYKKYNAQKQNTSLAKVLENKWYIDELYDTLIVKPLKALSCFFEKWIEKAGIDAIINGIGKWIQFAGGKFRLIQNGMVGLYMFFIVIGIILLFVVQLVYMKF